MNRFLFVLGPLLFAVMMSLPLSLTFPQQAMAATMLWVITWWLHPEIPLPITGLLGVSLSVLLGVVKFQTALAGFSNPVIFLFLGGFFFAQCLHYQGTDLWIARSALSSRFIKGSPWKVMVALTIITSLFSSLLSNSATAAMLMPMAMSLFVHLKVEEDHPSYKLLLLVAYAASIGGIGTPIGTPPNVIAVSLLKSMAGIQITFLDWVMKIFPLMIIATIALLIVFWKEFKLLPQDNREFAAPEELNTAQKRTLYLLGATVMLWFMPGILQLTLGSDHEFAKLVSERLPEGLVAIFMSSFLFLIPGKSLSPLLPWKEALKIEWGTLLLFGAGISLGQTVFETGLAEVVGSALPFQHLSYAFALLLVLVITLFLTEFMSNTASANLLVPLIIVTPPFNNNPLIPVICVTLVCSLGFMLPVGTPPNAIAYGTGKIKIKWMFDKGFKLNVVCLILIWMFGLIYQ